MAERSKRNDARLSRREPTEAATPDYIAIAELARMLASGLRKWYGSPSPKFSVQASLSKYSLRRALEKIDVHALLGDASDEAAAALALLAQAQRPSEEIFADCLRPPDDLPRMIEILESSAAVLDPSDDDVMWSAPFPLKVWYREIFRVSRSTFVRMRERGEVVVHPIERRGRTRVRLDGLIGEPLKQYNRLVGNG